MHSSFTHFTRNMSSSAASSSHHIVLTSSPDGPITAYDILSGTAIARFTGSRSPRHGLALAGKSFIAASHISSSANSGSIHLYNWWSSTALHHLPLPEPVAPIVTTKDGLYLFAGGLSGTVYSLSLPSGDVAKYFSAHDKPVSCLKISDDGSLLITGGDDGAIVVVPIFQLVDASVDQDNSNKLLFQRFASHNDSVTDINIGLLSSSMLSCSRDCTCKLWNLTGVQLQTFTFPCAILGVALDPSETEFYAGGSDGLIYKATMKVKTKQENSQRQKLVTTLPEKHGGAVVYVVMVNKGKHLLSASEDGSVFVWQAEREHMIQVLGNDTASISSLVVAVNGIGDGNSGGGSGGGGCSDGSGLSGREMISKSLRETMEVEDVLSEVGEDRSRAIDMLESAIGMYEKLLELILKEAMKGSNNNTSSEKEKD